MSPFSSYYSPHPWPDSEIKDFPSSFGVYSYYSGVVDGRLGGGQCLCTCTFNRKERKKNRPQAFLGFFYSFLPSTHAHKKKGEEK